jgi:hypothetical protein
MRYSLVCLVIACTSFPISASLAQVSWNLHVIHNNTHGTSSVHACDLDGDSALDVLGAVLEENQMVWWRNEGGNPITWTKFVIQDNFMQAFSVYAADGDLDKDGDMDVFAASTDLNLISWWRNDRGSPVQWTEQTIGAGFYGAKSVRVVDFNDDGDNDVVGACLYGNAVKWWRNDGGGPIQWTEFSIDNHFNGAHRVQAIDIDDDQDPDVLAVAYLDGEVAWYSNDGGDPLTWTKQTIGTGLAGACIAQAADLDDDGDLDVAASAQVSDEVCWWRNDSGTPIVWTKFYIDGYLYRVWPLYVCDLDDDLDQDVIAASSWAGINRVNWYENTGAGIVENIITSRSSPDSSPTIYRSTSTLPLDQDSRLRDIAGREVLSKSPAPGVYFIESEGRITSKIIVVL